MMRMRTFLFLSVLAMTSFDASGALGQDVEISAEERERDARALFGMASRHYETGRLDEAIDEFKRAYELFPLPAFQYNLYLANRDAGNLADAVAALRLYLDTEESIDDERRGSLERRHDALSSRVSSTEAADVPTPLAQEPAPPVVTDPGLTEAAPAEVEQEASGLSPLVGGVTLGVGAALLVGALVEGLVANGQKSDLDAVCLNGLCPASAQQEIVSRFETHRNVAWGLLYAGAAVTVTGVVLLLLSGGEEGADESTSASMNCDVYGCVGTLRQSF